jgi:hypothetical protein
MPWFSDGLQFCKQANLGSMNIASYVIVENSDDTVLQVLTQFIRNSTASAIYPDHYKRGCFDLWHNPEEKVLESIKFTCQLRRKDASVHIVVEPGQHLNMVFPGVYLSSFSLDAQRPVDEKDSTNPVKGKPPHRVTHTLIIGK